MSTIDEPYQTSAASYPASTEVAPSPEPAAEQQAPATTNRGNSRGLAWELVQTVFMTVLIFLVVRALVQNFRVEGASMEPSFFTGEYLLVNKAAYFHVEGTPLANILPTEKQGAVDYIFGGPQRGDIVVLKAPPQPTSDFIKRVIGLPGDSILIKQGVVYVNGQKLDEPYLHYHATYDYPTNGQPLILPADQYFVLGDNRPNSADSHLGWTVPVDNLIGKAWLAYWPPSDWGFVPHYSYGAAGSGQ